MLLVLQHFDYCLGEAQRTFLIDGVSAFICIWAFFCFARYCGDSRELENLRNRLVASPPAYPFRPVSSEDEPLVRSYGKVLGQFSTQGVIPVSKLPTSKARIKEALAVVASHADSHEAYASLRQGYLLLIDVAHK